MTRDEILNMEAGREMDALVATIIMGLEVHRLEKSYRGERSTPGSKVPGEWIHHVLYVYHTPTSRNLDVSHYSANISAAWEVVEKLQAEPLEYYFGINRTPSIPYEKTGRTHWHCELGGKMGYADTAPLAICKAALLAVMDD